MTSALRVPPMMTRFGTEGFPEPMHTELTRHGDTVIVAASGEIDLSSADRLQAQLRDLLSSFSRVVLDLRRVVFIDSTGLRCMLAVDKASRETGVEFLLVPGPREVQRLFRLTGADAALRFIDPNRIDQSRT
jgi:anti-sigma B factor antagonist